MSEVYRKTNLNHETIKELNRIHMDDTNMVFLGMNIISVTPGVFLPFQRLKRLDLQMNYLIELPADMLKGLTELKYINLHHNKIQEIPETFFHDNRKLEVIWLSGNEIAAIEKNTFAHLPKLKELYLSWNRIKFFDFRWLVKSNKLEQLSFCHNQLTAITDFANFKEYFPGLKRCSMDGNIFSSSYLLAVVKSFELQGIAIDSLDLDRGITENSVFGLKCQQDCYLQTQMNELEQKFKDKLEDNVKLLTELSKLRVSNENLQKEQEQIIDRMQRSEREIELERTNLRFTLIQLESKTDNLRRAERIKLNELLAENRDLWVEVGKLQRQVSQLRLEVGELSADDELEEWLMCKNPILVPWWWGYF